jgi:hypothetical protein
MAWSPRRHAVEWAGSGGRERARRMSFWSWRDSASRAAAEVHGATTGGGGAGVEVREWMEWQCWRRAEVEMAAAKAARRASAATACWARGESGRVMG